jgi:glycosyltransferase involved in cell wall biosynthesis
MVKIIKKLFTHQTPNIERLVYFKKMIFFLFTIKRRIEQILMYPFVLYGKYKVPAEMSLMEFDLFFFFPGYAIGGAEIVNSDIVACFPDKKIGIFFTKKSENNQMLSHFTFPNTFLFDISKWTDNKKKYWQSFIWRGICSSLINSQSTTPVVFNGQCNFAYKLSPWIKKNIRQVELIHMCVRPFNLITIPFVQFYHARIMITKDVMAKFKKLYKKFGVPDKYAARIQLINNKIDLPLVKPTTKLKTGVLKIFYAGRGGPQKRIGLIVKIATHLIEINAPLEFHFAGDFRNELPSNLPSSIIYHGILSRNEMKRFLDDKDILIMTSLFEGFPLIIMEAMSKGIVPVTTAVDGIVDHIISGYNGLLINEENEEKIVEKGIKKIQTLYKDTTLLKQLSQSAIDYAYNNFNSRTFEKNYRKVILSE